MVPRNYGFNLRETDVYYLIAKALKSGLKLSQNTIFFEVPVLESRADIAYVQPPDRNENLLACGIHLFEVKMPSDSSKKRLKKQIRDYMSVAEYVWIIGFNKIPHDVNENAGLLIFSSKGCTIKVVRPPKINAKTIDIGLREQLLENMSSSLYRKARLIDEMAWVNSDGERQVMIQKKLI